MSENKTRVDNAATGDIQHQGKDIFFAAVETTRMPMIVTDPNRPDNPIIFSNRAFSGNDGVYGRRNPWHQLPVSSGAGH
nr:hypothetical protein [Pseudomonas amygdali]